MPGLECTSDANLRAFLLGELPERVARSIASHLEVCPECEAAARRLDGLTDPVIERLRRGVRPGRRDRHNDHACRARYRRTRAAIDGRRTASGGGL